MTYLNFLITFLGGPLVGLAVLHRLDQRRGRASLGRAAWLAVAAHMLVAWVYTTPWDNYLVASGVWTYNPALVLGVTFGWVPLEEYLFFLLQPLVAGAWLLWLARRLPTAGARPTLVWRWRAWPAASVGLVWLGAVAVLIAGWAPGRYLALELAWALPPIALQLAVGGDVLWQQRRLVGAALASLTAYLCLADALAIASGTWTINPAFSLNIFLGPLPIEELVFFLITNTLIVFGVTLVVAGPARAMLSSLATALGRRPSATLARDES